MQLKYNNVQHKQYLHMTESNGVNWLKVFEGNKEFYSAAYWDLLTRIWKSDGPVRKTDALKFMTAIKSPHTAGKYVESAIRQGILLESDNPEDARSKLVSLSPETKRRLDAFFDEAVGELRESSRAIERQGPSPEAP